jgi:hypothetical protein
MCDGRRGQKVKQEERAKTTKFIFRLTRMSLAELTSEIYCELQIPEEAGTVNLRNIGNREPSDTVSHPT